MRTREGHRRTNRSDARISEPYGVYADASGNVYVAEYNNHRLRKLSVDGVLSTFAGTGASGSTIIAANQQANATVLRPLSVTGDAAGNIYLSGGLPYWMNNPAVSNAYQAARPGGNSDGFVLKLNPAANRILYATYFGGSADDMVADMELDAAGNAYLAVSTRSTDLPLKNG